MRILTLLVMSLGVTDLLTGANDREVAATLARIVAALQDVRDDVTILHTGYSGIFEEPYLKRLPKRLKKEGVDPRRYRYFGFRQLSPILSVGVDGIHLPGEQQALRASLLWRQTIAAAFTCGAG